MRRASDPEPHKHPTCTCSLISNARDVGLDALHKPVDSWQLVSLEPFGRRPIMERVIGRPRREVWIARRKWHDLCALVDPRENWICAKEPFGQRLIT
jgi:hypothetical protein